MRIETRGFWMLFFWGFCGLVPLFISPDGTRFTGFSLYNWWGLLFAGVLWTGAVLYEHMCRRNPSPELEEAMRARARRILIE